jgi:hypothetical protein
LISLMMRAPVDRAEINLGVGARGQADLAERSYRVNHSRIALSCSRRGPR